MESPITSRELPRIVEMVCNSLAESAKPKKKKRSRLKLKCKIATIYFLLLDQKSHVVEMLACSPDVGAWEGPPCDRQLQTAGLSLRRVRDKISVL